MRILNSKLAFSSIRYKDSLSCFLIPCPIRLISRDHIYDLLWRLYHAPLISVLFQTTIFYMEIKIASFKDIFMKLLKIFKKLLI